MDRKDFTDAVRNMRQGTGRLEREGEYWTEEEKERLTRLFNESVGITEIAVLLQRTERAIGQQIEKQGLYNEEADVVRRRRSGRKARCLCDRCQVGRASCPLWWACHDPQEDE